MAGGLAAAAAGTPLWVRPVAALPARPIGTPRDVARDEAYWGEVRRAYRLDPGWINLDSGAVNPSPQRVMEAQQGHLDVSNLAPTWTMNRVLAPGREEVRRRLAASFGAHPEEIALCRNTTEAMQNVIMGLPLSPGDEVVTTTQDFWRFLDALRQREERDGIRVHTLSLPIPAEDEAEIVARFAEAITPRTRALLICHVMNLSGQVMPVRALVELGVSRGLEVLVDGAHGFGQFDFRLEDLGCEVYGTSLHKWLGAPMGTGMLYVRRDRIPDFYPLFPAAADLRDDIRKFESLGTIPVAGHLAIAEALDFWMALGPSVKEARLLHLRDYWMDALEGHPRIRWHTSRKPGWGGALVTVEVVGMDARVLQERLLEQDRILVRAIRHAEFQGVRVTPNVFTSPAELDRLVAALGREAERA
jgi:selenocysteine lyase/cysteine desulfurase